MAENSGLRHIKEQRGAAPVFIIGGVVVVAIIALLLWLNSGKDDDEKLQTAAEERPMDVKSVDLASAGEIEKVGGTKDGRSDEQKLDRLFREEQTKRPFKDGFESEDIGREVAMPILDAFDFGVLDGRVRVGLFGNGSIPKYSTRQIGNEFIIEIPGSYSFRSPLERRLAIDAFRVNVARLEHSEQGLKLKISTSPPLEHDPYIIEDPYGLMMAFEPRR